MKLVLIIITVLTFSLAAIGQTKNNVKKPHSRIKSASVLIVPDQKPVIIDRTEDPVIADSKQNALTPGNNPPAKPVKKSSKAKSAKASASGYHKKPGIGNKNKTY